MEKCLITKLNGVVNNNSIETLGSFRFSVAAKSSVSASDEISLEIKDDCIIKAIKGVFYRTVDRNVPLTTCTLEKNTPISLYPSNEDIIIEVSNKYDIFRFRQGDEYNMSANLKYFKYSNDIEDLRIQNAVGDISSLSSLTKIKMLAIGGLESTGDLSSLSNLTELERLDVGLYIHSHISGNISALGVLPKLVRFDMNADAVGSLESLVSVLRSNGRTSGTIYIGALPKAVTFNGEQAGNSDNLVWTSSSITYKGTTISS